MTPTADSYEPQRNATPTASDGGDTLRHDQALPAGTPTAAPALSTPDPAPDPDHPHNLAADLCHPGELDQATRATHTIDDRSHWATWLIGVLLLLGGVALATLPARKAQEMAEIRERGVETIGTSLHAERRKTESGDIDNTIVRYRDGHGVTHVGKVSGYFEAGERVSVVYLAEDPAVVGNVPRADGNIGGYVFLVFPALLPSVLGLCILYACLRKTARRRLAGKLREGGVPAGGGTARPGVQVDWPRLHLAHNMSTRTVEEDASYTKFVTTHALHPIEIPRPETGRTRALIRCGTCSELMICTVYSAQESRTSRILLRWAKILMAYAVAGGAAVLLWGPLAGFGFVVGAVIVMGILGKLRRPEDGVRIDGHPSRHSLRPPGATEEEWFAMAA